MEEILNVTDHFCSFACETAVDTIDRVTAMAENQVAVFPKCQINIQRGNSIVMMTCRDRRQTLFAGESGHLDRRDVELSTDEWCDEHLSVPVYFQVTQTRWTASSMMSLSGVSDGKGCSANW